MIKYDPDNPTIVSRLRLDENEYSSNQTAEVNINGYQYSLTVEPIQEEQREWFLGVFSNILIMVDAQARKEVRKDREKKMRALCGLD